MAVRSALEPKGVPPEIQSRLEAAGLRRTLNTRAVLGLFLAKPGVSLSHGQVQATLTARGLDINRVTLYRLLDRLAASGVLQRHADANRTWRFRFMEPQSRSAGSGSLPHFECDACHRRFSVEEVPAKAHAIQLELFRALARQGHRGSRLDLLLHGTCAACMSTEAASGPAA